MDYHKKYIKYKEKYLQLKNRLQGGNDTSVDATTIEEYLNHLYLVSSQDEWNFFNQDNELIFAHSRPSDIDSQDIIDLFPLLHPYPTVHTVWGTLVYPHSTGSWEFSKCAVIVKASDYKDRIYKLNPYDTMLLIDKFIINKNVDVVIAQSKFNTLKTEIKKILTEKANSLTIYDDSPKDNYTYLLTNNTNHDDFVDEYKKNYNSYFDKPFTEDAQMNIILQNIKSYGIQSISSGDSNNSLVAGMFLSEDYGTKNVDPYIFAKTYFKTCLRDAIDKKIESMQQTKPETDHINIQIYCNPVDKQNRKHDPLCYRKIHIGETDILKRYDDTKDYTFKGNTISVKDESSILGPHSASLLNNLRSTNIILKFIDYCVNNIKSKNAAIEQEIIRQLNLIKPQYEKLTQRNVLPIAFKDSKLQFYLLFMLQINFNKMIKKEKKTDSELEELNKLHTTYKNIIINNT
jgi:hypothetical protein